jgi:hypothetical protein
MQALAVFFFQPRRAVLRLSVPRFVRRLIYLTQHEIVSRKHKARSALGIDTPKIPFRS